MAPKFRGDADDWLDEKEQGSRQLSKSKKIQKARSLPASETNATVAEIFPNQCRVLSDDHYQSYSCVYRRSLVLRRNPEENEVRERSPVAVGDRVKFDPIGESEGVLVGVSSRKNQIMRPAPDRDEAFVHVLAANLDYLVIVTSTKDPEFSPGLVDRFLVAALKQEIPVILCVNKMDLLSVQDSVELPKWNIYNSLNIEIIELSAKRSIGIDQLKSRISSRTVAFCGHSGVGKTSLLRTLLGSDFGRVGGVNETTRKGRHTTSGAVMTIAQGGGKYIDTPGVREFGLFGILPKDLQTYFPEFTLLGCTENGCTHQKESNCEARGFPRYSSYLRILESLEKSD